jgi:uncharacterized integral membrane protein
MASSPAITGRSSSCSDRYGVPRVGSGARPHLLSPRFRTGGGRDVCSSHDQCRSRPPAARGCRRALLHRGRGDQGRRLRRLGRSPACAPESRPWRIWLIAAEARRGWTWRVFVIGLAYAATLTLFVLANRLTTSANTIFLQSTAPLYLALLAPWLLRGADPASGCRGHGRHRRSDLGLTFHGVGPAPAPRLPIPGAATSWRQRVASSGLSRSAGSAG